MPESHGDSRQHLSKSIGRCTHELRGREGGGHPLLSLGASQAAWRPVTPPTPLSTSLCPRSLVPRGASGCWLMDLLPQTMRK